MYCSSTASLNNLTKNLPSNSALFSNSFKENCVFMPGIRLSFSSNIQSTSSPNLPFILIVKKSAPVISSILDISYKSLLFCGSKNLTNLVSDTESGSKITLAELSSNALSLNLKVWKST